MLLIWKWRPKACGTGTFATSVWPLAQHTTGGALTGSTNPLVDEHVIVALALIVVGVGGAASRLGFGALWAKLPFVQRHRALL